MARYNIVAATNPVFVWQLGSSFETNTGPDRAERLLPFRTYTESGVIMASGSDFGVATHNPWMGFYALLTRKDQTTGRAYGIDETLGIEDALRSFTWNGAYLTHEERFKGSLEVGKVADLVVLNIADIYELERNPELTFEMPERIDLTMVDGRVVFERGAAAASTLLWAELANWYTVITLLAHAVGAIVGAEDEVALVGRDPRLDLLTARVDRVAEVLRRLVDAVDESRQPEVVPASPPGADGAEVEVAVGRDRRRPLTRRRRADGRGWGCRGRPRG
jgi:hypothetical protein